MFVSVQDILPDCRPDVRDARRHTSVVDGRRPSSQQHAPLPARRRRHGPANQRRMYTTRTAVRHTHAPARRSIFHLPVAWQRTAAFDTAGRPDGRVIAGGLTTLDVVIACFILPLVQYRDLTLTAASRLTCSNDALPSALHL